MMNETEILLIEDNMSDAELTIRALKRNRLVNRLTHLKDGEEALEYFFGEKGVAAIGSGSLPKVVLLDLKMPKVDGMDVLKRLKSDPRTRGIPVVVLTSSREDPDIRNCYELGVNSYIVKPVDFEQFVKSVGDVGLYWMVLNHPPS